MGGTLTTTDPCRTPESRPLIADSFRRNRRVPRASNLMAEEHRVTPADPPPKRPDDRELVRASRRGETQAFGELVERYQDRVFNLAFRLTGNRDAAADAAQEAFLKAWSALDAFRGESAFYTWLFRITVNVVRSRHRYQAVRPAPRSLDANPRAGTHEDRPALADELKADVPDPAEEAGRAERRKLVEQALARLDPDQRAMIVLRDIEGRSYAEIAELIECPRGTVKSRIHRARLALKHILAPVLAPAQG